MESDLVERMRQKLIEIAVLIRREQVRAALGPLEHTSESAHLEELYLRLRAAYARRLDQMESEKTG